jgi:acetyltransferase-like isoleucine patch superfamily enzyme
MLGAGDTPVGHAREDSIPGSGRSSPWLRIAWAALSVFLVECLVFGLSVVAAAVFWEAVSRRAFAHPYIRTVVLCMAFVPAYVLFAFSLLVLSALSTRLLGWRTPPNAEMSIGALEWPILRWARYMVSVHIARLFAGSVFRATPLWTFYLRLNGARLGRRVYINSLAVNDHNLLEFGDGVVIGDGVHLSGHTVERGVVKTAAVRLGDNVTIGLGSVVGIGVEAEPDAQVGALSLVPKFSRLRRGVVYVGTPIRPLEPRPRRRDAVAPGGSAAAPTRDDPARRD